VTDFGVHRPLDRPAAVGGFMSLLRAGGEDLRESLGALLGRQDVRIAYWLADSERWVDENGRSRLVDVSETGVTVVRYRGEPVAALLLDPPPEERLRLDSH
jgi:hypothetical protein